VLPVLFLLTKINLQIDQSHFVCKKDIVTSGKF